MARRALAAAPATVPMAAAVALLIGAALAGGAQPAATWGWAAVVALGLLAAAVRAVPLELGGLPWATRIALAALAAYTLWSFASIAWADDRGAALEGADRTLLYLVVLALFAAWRQRGATAAFLLGSWTLALAGFAAYVVLRLPGSGAAQELFLDGRLDAPTGYPNAAAALWLMALWPALALASARDVPWGLRGAFAAAAVLFADLGLLTQSRGALLATPIVLVLGFALLGDRVRRMVVLVPVAGAAAATAPALLHALDVLGTGADAGDALTAAGRAIVLAAAGAGIVVALGGLLELRRVVDERRAARTHRVLGALGLALALAVVAGGLAAAGDPRARLDSAWSSFKQGYAENDATGSRLTSGLGSNRYDFYRVALEQFRAQPLTGAGADNFAQDYLAARRSEETPRYPHSLELRALAQTGIVGALLLAVALAAALAAALAGARAPGPLGRAAAIGATGAFLQWLVHGSADWFWEFAGLGAPAFAWLGLAAALAPRPGEQRPPRWPLLYGRPAAKPAAAAALLAAVVLLAPWLAGQDERRAGELWRTDPAGAYARLERARTLNPLSDRADLLAGSVAVRAGDLRRADAAFARALARNPRGSYATLQRGAIASQQGRRRAALALLGRARALDPRDRLTGYALRVTRGGGRVDVRRLNEAILAEARSLAG